MSKIALENIRPSLLRFGYFNGFEVPDIHMITRTCYDYELEYFIKSEGGILVDGKKYPLHGGDLSIRLPGQVVKGIAPYECYVLCIDLTGSRYCPDNYLFGSPEQCQPLYQNPVLDNLPHIISYSRPNHLLALFREIQHYLEINSPSNQIKVNSIVQYIFSDVIQETEQQKKLNSKSSRHVLQAIEHINRHYTEEINLSALIRDLGISKACFNRSFRDYCSMTPGEVILSKRIEKAQMLLSFQNITICEIASLCGFSDPSYFARQFHKKVGCTPKEYRRRFHQPK